MSSITFLTASWLPIFASGEPSQTILSIDISEKQDSRATQGVKIKKTVKIDGNFIVLCQFSAK